ncbi:MAG: DUF5615 family PIN-like protein [Candidatus Doudnabacteria bacterium]|nr:DUF5615 family PIN-like protein [Candidatus Doudnabacteria bacterium]
MAKFLIDENLSPAIAFYLHKSGYKAKAVRDTGLKGESDEIILNFAAAGGWVIITGDIEFGRFFYERLGEISVIVIRSHSQNISAVLKILADLNKRNILKRLPAKHFLVTATHGTVRTRKYGK